MRGSLLCTAVVVGSVLFVPRQVPAHHAFTSEFNPNKVLMINGTISEVSWTNPHVAIKVAVKDPSGRAELWTVRGDSPVVLERNGWNRRALVVGQQLVACGYEATRGQHEMSGEQVALANGARMPFATTDVKSCQRVDLRSENQRQSSAAGQRSNTSRALITNPVGAMGNPISPMGNPIPPMANPVAPAGNPK
jgi:hypothetical protein